MFHQETEPNIRFDPTPETLVELNSGSGGGAAQPGR